MTDITIPPEALEAAARTEYERACARGSNTAPKWEFLPEDRKRLWLDDARAACLAMLRAWPGAYTDPGGYPRRDLILPLPKEGA